MILRAKTHPLFTLSQQAFEQILLIQEMDHTLDGLQFRIKIDGKICSGFTYETGFSAPLAEDKELLFTDAAQRELKILIDDFTLHYSQEAHLEYRIDPEMNEDGFVFTNAKESAYHGKFFEDESMVPASFSEVGHDEESH